MADNLRAAIDELVGQLGTLANRIDANEDEGVELAIAPQLKFFTMVQNRSADLQADVTAAKKRLGKGRHNAWAGTMMAQAAQDVRDGAMGRSDAEKRIIEGTALTIKGFADLTETALSTLPPMPE